VKRWLPFTPALGALVLEGLFSRLSFGLISFALPLYARHLGLSLSQIGVLVALNTGVSLALKPLMGLVADRWGRRRTLLAGIGLRSVVAGLLGVVSAPWHLYAIRGVHGISMSLRDPSVNALIADEGGEQRVATAFAWYQTAKSLAGQLSKSAAGFLLALTASDFQVVFLTAFGLSVLPALVVALFVKPDRLTSRPAAVEPPPEPAAGARRPNTLSFMGLGFLIRGSADMVDGLVPIIAIEYAGLTPGETGLIYAAGSAVLVFSGPLFGWLADNVSSMRVLSIRGLANAVSSVLYALVPGLWGMLAAKTLDDLGKAAYRPAWGAVMARVSAADPGSRARTMGWLTVGEDVGSVLAPALAGFLWTTWGLGVAMAVRAALALGTEAYTLMMSTHPGPGTTVRPRRAPEIPTPRAPPPVPPPAR
jgi:MFS family permease